MSWNSLFVGRNFPVTECRETCRVGPREGVGRENLAPPASRVRANSLYFPCTSGISSPETSSRQTAPTAIQSAAAETLRSIPDVSLKFPRFRGVLDWRLCPVRTREAGTPPRFAPRSEIFSAADRGGSDSSPHRGSPGGRDRAVSTRLTFQPQNPESGRGLTKQ